MTFDQLYDNYFGKLCYFCFQITQDSFLAEESAAWAIRMLILKKVTINSEAQNNYLYKVAKRRAFQLMNFTRTRHRREREAPKQWLSEDAANKTKSEVVARLYREILKLPEQQKTCILLRLDGLSDMEIAAKMNLTLNTVSNYMQIIKGKLKAKLNPAA